MRKVPVDVLVHHDAMGNKIPLRLNKEGKRFAVDRVLDMRAGASLKAECKGIRYLISISNDEEEIYNKRCHLWLGTLEGGRVDSSNPEVWYVLEE